MSSTSAYIACALWATIAERVMRFIGESTPRGPKAKSEAKSGTDHVFRERQPPPRKLAPPLSGGRQENVVCPCFCFRSYVYCPEPQGVSRLLHRGALRGGARARGLG